MRTSAPTNQGYGSGPTAGNLTKESHWDGTKFLDTAHVYDAFANMTSTTDPLFPFVIDPSTHAQPISITVDPRSGAGVQTSMMVNDYWTGLVTSETYPNQKTTSISYTNQLLGGMDPFGVRGCHGSAGPEHGEEVLRYGSTGKALSDKSS